MVRRVITAVVVPFILFLGVAAGNLQTWDYPHLWLVFGIVVVACILQPTYKPMDTEVPEHDRYTSTQIVWTVYLAMVASVAEAVYFRFPESFVWDAYSSAALVIAVAGLGLRTWGYLTLGRLFTWHITVYDDHEVVQRGPYAWMRHPGYTGAWLLYSAVPLMLHAWVGLAISVVFQFLAYARRIKHEESVLSASLGESYEGYRARVSAMVPYIW